MVGNRRSHFAPSRVRVLAALVSVRTLWAPAGRLTVALISGPVYIPKLDQVLEARAVDDPTFVPGETVLLFLTNGYTETPTLTGPSDDLPENFFRPVNGAKLLIDGTTATLQGWGQGEYNVVRADYAIRQVVGALSTNCE